mgnify:FL=1
MDRTQANNFIAILRTALGNGQVPLEHPDWDKLAEWADLQSLTALFYTGACQFQEFAQWDGTKRQKLQRETIAGVVAQSTRTELFLDVYRSLLEKGQKPLVLKGVVVRQLYGELSDYRPSCDEDLYVRPEEAIPCRRELENLGFRITVPEDERKLSDPFQEVSLDHSSGMLHVELHPNFFERSREDLRLSNRYYQNAHDTAVPINTGGTTLWTLDETHHFLYLFLHLAKHFKGAGVGVKQMVDLLVADRAWRDKIRWEYIKQAVEELRCGKLYGAVLAVGRDLGFAPTELFPPQDPAHLLEDSLEGGVYGHSDPSRTYGSIITAAAVNTGEKTSVLKAIFPSYDYMVRGWEALRKNPWLLPVGYIKRFYRVLVSRKQGKEALIAIQKGQERTKLLQEYGILPEKRR